MIDPSNLNLKSGKPALHLVASTNSVSASRWGGMPEVPAGWKWPVRADGTPLSFLGQVDLAQTQAALALDYLPKDGLLLFFYDTQDQPWGFDPKDGDGWKIEYIPPGTPLEQASLEETTTESPEVWSVCPLDFRLIETYEEGMPSVDDSIELSDDDTDVLIEFVSDRNFGDQPHHQMGGYPDPIQNPDMERECELASNQLYVGTPEGYNSKRGQAVLGAGGARDWRLVLQVDSDDEDGKGPGWMWGDCGMLYFWVKEEAGRRGDFSKAWLVLQCS